MSTATVAEVGEVAPDYVIPCWVDVYYPETKLCVDKIAEWVLVSAVPGGTVPPVCTGCKNRMLRLNPNWIGAVRL